jgi:hypothetical protein
MEESGHYYTVYFTSLAVGFSTDVAYNHASLAQMPDEVGYLDAAHMHILQCVYRSEYNLSGHMQKSAHEWRFLIEFALHSLPDKSGGNASSAFQRMATSRLLARESPISTKFGLLLHRLGDTYAHSIIGNEKKLYTVSSSGNYRDCVKFSDSTGHARDGHDPDYPFLRVDLFIQYLEALYTVLLNKAKSRESMAYIRRVAQMPFSRLSGIFRNILENPHGLIHCSMIANLSKEAIQKFFIMEIRKACRQEMGVNMETYAPEDKDNQSLGQFLSEHPKLTGVSESSIIDAIRSINDEINATTR